MRSCLHSEHATTPETEFPSLWGWHSSDPCSLEWRFHSPLGLERRCHRTQPAAQCLPRAQRLLSLLSLASVAACPPSWTGFRAVCQACLLLLWGLRVWGLCAPPSHRVTTCLPGSGVSADVGAPPTRLLHCSCPWPVRLWREIHSEVPEPPLGGPPTFPVPAPGVLLAYRPRGGEPAGTWCH